jgi:hypothetical protein
MLDEIRKTPVEEEDQLYTCSHNEERGQTGLCEDCEWLYRLQCSGMEDFCG